MSQTEATTRDLEQVLHDRFGLEEFRPGQREVIEAVLAGRDVLCVMPTGGGKSLCYQLPALLLDGLTLVVSPLIALMKDQVDALQERGIRATLINSTLDPAEQRARILEVAAGKYDLVYVAPERFRSPMFVDTIRRVRLALLAVDEAHCISEWGHDFRPDYARLGRARVALGSPPCIALTATATDVVRRDIADQLDLREPATFVTGFDRPNLAYHVVPARRDVDKMVALDEVLKELPGASIIYASSRKRCEQVADFVARTSRRSVVIYHAGMTREERHDAQDRFMSGRAEVVVATNAFGMGVDKADIRSVIHFNVPGTLEAYYQEAGRAGRDAAPSRCVLLFSEADRRLQEMFIENEYPPPEEVFRVYDFLRGLDADPIELTHTEIAEAARTELREGGVGAALRLLEGAGAIEKFLPRENMAIVRINTDPEEGSLVERLGSRAPTQELVLRALEGLARGRHREPVYFHPHEVAAALGLDRAAFGRAIRNLTEDLPIDYVPPFRGNAVRVLDRERRPRDLTIDFKRLEQRKRQEYDKLDRMFQYGYTTKCRRAYLLDYFGELRRGQCGNCDRCGDAGANVRAAQVIDTDAGREVLLKVLSGVARARGRVGKMMVADMLVGSGSARVEKLGLKSLSTFGVLANDGLTRQAIVMLIESLTAAGLIEAHEVGEGGPSRRVVSLSDSGWEWLRARGPTPLTLDLPNELAEFVRRGGVTPAEPPDASPREERASSGVAPGRVDSVGDAEPLETHLRALRRLWANEARVRAYQVFPDRVLDAIVQARPSTPAELSLIKGVGPSTLERYGEGILCAVRETAKGPPPSSGQMTSPIEAPGPSGPVRAPSRPDVAPRGGYVPTEEWTWRLLERGFTPGDAAEIRGLDLSAIVRHATLLARQGKDVPLDPFLGEERLRTWSEFRLARPGETPTDAGEDQGLWSLFLACQRPAR
jgi:ATP-dependent DNA helicase RecQ